MVLCVLDVESVDKARSATLCLVETSGTCRSSEVRGQR